MTWIVMAGTMKQPLYLTRHGQTWLNDITTAWRFKNWADAAIAQMYWRGSCKVKCICIPYKWARRIK